MSRDEGAAFARKHGCLFVETSAKANVAVGQAFEELVRKVPRPAGIGSQGSWGGAWGNPRQGQG